MSFQRVIKGITVLAAIGVCGVAGFVATLWAEHKRATTLPEPAGRFAVGRATYDWVNPALTDELAPMPGTKREVVAWVWYPAMATASAKHAEYMPGPWREALRKYTGPVIGLLTRDLAKVQAHSYADSQVSQAESAYPVVILRAGLGALTLDYTTLAEDLASHGYIVLGFDAPHRTLTVAFSDGRIVTRRPEDNPEMLGGSAAEKLAERLLAMWCADARFVANQLEKMNRGEVGDGRFRGRLDLARMGMFGHSFGGAQAAEFCREDVRCKAGIDMDGRPFGEVVTVGLQKPFLFLMSDHRGEQANAESQRIMAEIRGIYESVPAKEGSWVTIRGTNHFSFSDQILLRNQMILGTARFFGVGGNVSGRRGLHITRALVSDFFDTHLKGLRSRQEGLAAEYPELEIETR